MVRSVDFLYSLYDALVSINVPNDKARAVVDAMERDMATHLATKPDLSHQRLALKADIDQVRVELKAYIDQQRVALKSDIDQQRVELRAEIDGLRVEMHSGFALLRKDMDSLRARLTIQFGSMLVVMTGLVLAVLRLG